MMETEIQMLEVSPRPRTGQSKPSSRSSSGGCSIEYTSLKDVILEGGPAGRPAGYIGGSCPKSGYDIHDFDASNIGIRNQLLKHAASAYLQSAVIIASRDQSCLSRLWWQMQQRRRVLLRPCTWHGCVDDPVELCVMSMARSARRVVAFLVDHVACMWA